MELYIIGFAFYFGLTIKDDYNIKGSTSFKNSFLYVLGLVIWPVMLGMDLHEFLTKEEEKAVDKEKSSE